MWIYHIKNTYMEEIGVKSKSRLEEVRVFYAANSICTKNCVRSTCQYYNYGVCACGKVIDKEEICDYKKR